MRFRRGRSWLVLTLFAIVALQCAAETRWRWDEDQSRSYELRIVRSQNALADRNYRSRLKVRALLGFQSSKKSAGESPTLHMRIEQLRIERQAGKSYSFFDSEADLSDSGSESAWATLGRALLANDYLMRQTPAGALELLEGTSEGGGLAFESALENNPREAFILLQVFGDHRLTQLLNSLIYVLPDIMTTETKSWSRSEEVDLGFDVVVRRDMDYTIEKSDDDNVWIDIAGGIGTIDGEDGLVELPGGSADVRIEDSSIDGKSIFSNSKGCISKSELHGKMDMKMIVKDKNNPGKSSEVRSRLVQDASLKLIGGSGAMP